MRNDKTCIQVKHGTLCKGWLENQNMLKIPMETQTYTLNYLSHTHL